MRRRSLAVMVALVIAVAIPACRTRPVALPIVTVGPMMSAPEVSFARLLAAARSLGYEPTRVEPRFGSFEVRARHREGDEEAAYFLRVQCFRDRRVQVIPGGAEIAPPRGDRPFRVPQPLRDELLTLAHALDAADGDH